MKNHEIDYKISGEELQCVEIELDPQEAVIAEPGSFMMMTEGIEMQTMFGDGSNQGGFMGKLFTAGKRLLTGENLFMTVYSNVSNQKRQVTFAGPYTGKIIPMNLAQLGGKIICQKDSFLCAAKGVDIGIEFQKKLGTGLFGGEGFIMQK
ncbi:MAG: AIM24 family protein, partial [Bacteroidia bacterium]|nr:AIM24 family protein [Bacteroidia bacterium]